MEVSVTAGIIQLPAKSLKKIKKHKIDICFPTQREKHSVAYGNAEFLKVRREDETAGTLLSVRYCKYEAAAIESEEEIYHPICTSKAHKYLVCSATSALKLPAVICMPEFLIKCNKAKI